MMAVSRIADDDDGDPRRGSDPAVRDCESDNAALDFHIHAAAAAALPGEGVSMCARERLPLLVVRWNALEIRNFTAATPRCHH